MFGLFGNTFVHSKRYGDRMFDYEKLCFATIENPRVGGSNPPPGHHPSITALILQCFWPVAALLTMRKWRFGWPTTGKCQLNYANPISVTAVKLLHRTDFCRRPPT
jgi:hypothetical protein